MCMKLNTVSILIFEIVSGVGIVLEVVCISEVVASENTSNKIIVNTDIKMPKEILEYNSLRREFLSGRSLELGFLIIS
jgi:hypothetical protein